MCKFTHFSMEKEGLTGVEVILGQKNPVVLVGAARIFRPVISAGWSNYGEENAEKCFYVFCWKMSEIGGQIFE